MTTSAQNVIAIQRTPRLQKTTAVSAEALSRPNSPLLFSEAVLTKVPPNFHGDSSGVGVAA
jgi:hypothetical protein